MFGKIWERLFKGGPLYQEKELEFLGQKSKLLVYNKKRLLEAIGAAPHGSIMLISPTTYIMVAHVRPEDLGPQCDLDCENCGQFRGYGEGEGDGC